VVPEDTTHLRRSWAELTGSLDGRRAALLAIGTDLLHSWGDPARHYHNLTHLQHVLRRVDELAQHAEDIRAVRLAAWYHDAVYDGLPDDEARSAQRAQAELDAAAVEPALIVEVVRLVRLTAHHNPAAGDRNGETLCDADLAILAASAEDYAAYTHAVRAEYAHYQDAAFRAGRAAVLQSLLDLPQLFRTPRGRADWEPRARANLRAELAELRSV
jgi:predicted metal-dependent HD superfamily phosphohydrolase